VLGTGTMMNANNSIENNSDCLADAWEFGTEEGDGDEYSEWYYTNKYFNMWCLEEME
jgi:hypothetical protein